MKKVEKSETVVVETSDEIQAPTPFGSTIVILCQSPDLTFDDLKKALAKLKIDVDSNKSAIRTGYSQARRIFSELRKNGKMN